MRIGIFGGTFDPPHIGHQILAVEALEQAHLDKVLWVLTPNPPHKQGVVITPVEKRQVMVEKMIKQSAEFVFSDVEIRRPGPHYAVDTMRLLRRDHPGDEFYYVMGGDSLRDLPDWHTPSAFIDACAGLLVLRRPGVKVNLKEMYKQNPNLRQKVTFLHAPLVEISAAEIRSRANGHRMFWQFLFPEVYHYIVHEGLYR